MAKVQTDHDWRELKAEYFISKETSVSEFLRSKGIERNGGVSKQVQGWAEEKLKMKDDAFEAAKRDTEKKLRALYTPSEEDLGITYKAVMGILMAKAVSNHQKIRKLKDGTILIPPDVNTNETINIWNVIKAERGEPTSFRDKDDYVPPTDERDDEDVIFYLPDNGRDTLPVGEKSEE